MFIKLHVGKDYKALQKDTIFIERDIFLFLCSDR